MLRHRLAGHVDVLAELVERLSVVDVESVEQVSPGRIGERLEHEVDGRAHGTQ